MQKYAILLVLCLLLVWSWMTHTVKVEVNGRKYNVVGRYRNREKAAAIFAELHARMVRVMTHLKKKYVGWDSASLDAGGTAQPLYARDDLRNIALAIIRNYDPDKFYENDPALSGETAYTLNKGSTMYFCIRDKETNSDFCDFNILLFAMLHETSHIGTYNDWGHTTRFWEVFKFVLSEAAECGAYNPVDYSKSPRVYCGLEVGYNPLFDNGLRDLRQKNGPYRM